MKLSKLEKPTLRYRPLTFEEVAEPTIPALIRFSVGTLWGSEVVFHSYWVGAQSFTSSHTNIVRDAEIHVSE